MNLRLLGLRARHAVLGTLLGLFAISIFVTDMALPSGFNASYLYTLVVLAVGLWSRRWLVIVTAATVLALSLYAFVQKIANLGDIPQDLFVFSRVSSMVVIALTAVIVLAWLSRARTIDNLVEELRAAAGERDTARHVVAAAHRVTNIGTWSFDYNDESRLNWSDELAALFGMPLGHQPTSDEVLSYHDPDDAVRVRDAIRAANLVGDPFMEEATITTTDGARKTVLVMGQAIIGPDGKPVATHGVIQDVTLWRDAESAVATQRRRFTQLATSLPFIIWTADGLGTVDYFNEAAERYSGMTGPELLRDGWVATMHPDDAEALSARWEHALETRTPFEAELRLRHRDGTYHWHQTSAQPEISPLGEVLRWWGCTIDIDTIYQLREDTTQLAMERKMILEGMSDGVYTLDRDWRFRYLNSTAEFLMGGTSEELVGKKLWEEFPEVVGTQLDDSYRTAMRTREPTHLTNYNRVLEKHFDITVYPSEVGLTVFFRDVTEIKKLSDQLDHSQRLESVGRLTGGIAHDFNNLLTVVTGGAEAIGDDPALTEESREMASLILQAATRGAELTHRLLAFARRQPLEPVPTDIREQFEAIGPLLRRTLGESVSVVVVKPEKLPLVAVDPGQLENALLNLAINARDAMPDGGTLTLEARTVEVEAVSPTPHGEIAPGPYVVVTVSDTGTGIDPEIVPRLFDPFFTTKGLGQGSGLGLPMVWGFATQSGGHVSVASHPGAGTSFELYLPLAPSGATAAVAPEPDAAAPMRGSGHIMVVEDDALVQKFAADQLRSSGYEVTVASSGAEALTLIDGLSQIDLLFTDVIMPGGLTGRDLAERLLEKRPGTPVLYASGYTEDVILTNGRLDAGVALLAKPYSGRTLLQRVHETLRRGEEVNA